jgi:hypothetical protein
MALGSLTELRKTMPETQPYNSENQAIEVS